MCLAFLYPPPLGCDTDASFRLRGFHRLELTRKRRSQDIRHVVINISPDYVFQERKQGRLWVELGDRGHCRVTLQRPFSTFGLSRKPYREALSKGVNPSLISRWTTSKGGFSLTTQAPDTLSRHSLIWVKVQMNNGIALESFKELDIVGSAQAVW